ncbi:MAG: Sec-independent protein translocase protein TatB [Acidimicrobiia bacterium]
MFNVGGTELLVILLVALIVLGPDKLPETARKIGNVMGQLRRMSSGFQNELRSAMDDATREPTPTSSAPAPKPTPVTLDKPARVKLEKVTDRDGTAGPSPAPGADTRGEPNDPAA